MLYKAELYEGLQRIVFSGYHSFVSKGERYYQYVQFDSLISAEYRIDQDTKASLALRGARL